MASASSAAISAALQMQWRPCATRRASARCARVSLARSSARSASISARAPGADAGRGADANSSETGSWGLVAGPASSKRVERVDVRIAQSFRDKVAGQAFVSVGALTEAAFCPGSSGARTPMTGSGSDLSPQNDRGSNSAIAWLTAAWRRGGSGDLEPTKSKLSPTCRRTAPRTEWRLHAKRPPSCEEGLDWMPTGPGHCNVPRECGLRGAGVRGPPRRPAPTADSPPPTARR